MPTTAERHALLFLAALAATGAGVRLQRSWSLDRVVDRAFADSTPRALADRAAATQLAAVDSARSSQRRRARSSKASTTASGATTPGTPTAHPPGPVAVNQATAPELERLPSIGPALAQRIIAFRERYGPFRTLDDLLGVPGIGKATVSKLAPLVKF